MKVETQDQAIAILKKTWPLMRRTSSTAIIHSGARQTVFGCVCGCRHTASTQWRGREAKHVYEWQREHSACAIELVNQHLDGQPITPAFGR